MLKRMALLLAVCLLVSAGPALAAEILASGTQEGFSWKLDRRPIEMEDAPTYMGEGVWIVVTGTGAIPDYLGVACTNLQRAPWWWESDQYLYQVRGIEIGRGITAIGNNTFYLPSGADLYGQEVVVPDTVKRIGDYAFYSGYNLSRVVLPDSVTSFGKECFDPLTVLVCSSGSKAWAYAKANGYPVELTDLKVKLDKSSYALYVGDKAGLGFTPSVADAEISYKVNANGSFTFDEDTGTITATAPGKGTVTLMNQTRALAKVSVTVRKKPLENYALEYALNGGKNASGNPKTLAVGSAVTLKNPSRAGYSFKGWLCGGTLIKKLTARRAKASADEDGTVRLSAAWEKISVATPDKPALSSAKAGRLTVKLNKVSSAKGYQIQYSTKKTFPKASTRTENTAKARLTLKARSGKTWYVRVRAWKKDSAGKKVYGDWSAKAKVKVK